MSPVKITGYRTLSTHHDWGRVVGDVNGLSAGTRTAVEILVLETDAGVEGIALGPHPAIDRIFPVVAGAIPERCSTCTTGCWRRRSNSVTTGPRSRQWGHSTSRSGT